MLSKASIGVIDPQTTLINLGQDALHLGCECSTKRPSTKQSLHRVLLLMSFCMIYNEEGL
jgi:hypothetical protein